MSKTKKSNSGHYEILFIVPNKFTEEEAKQIIVKVENIIVKSGGEISYQEYWGKKKLAYEIKHNAYGYYALIEFDADKEAVLIINQSLRLSTDILRHQIVSKKVKSEKEIARAKVIQKKIEAKKEEEAKIAKTKTEKKEFEYKKGKQKDKSDLKELDEKLEGILNAKDLI
jgi:small subunit ribosomal protein S6